MNRLTNEYDETELDAELVPKPMPEFAAQPQNIPIDENWEPFDGESPIDVESGGVGTNARAAQAAFGARQGFFDVILSPFTWIRDQFKKFMKTIIITLVSIVVGIVLLVVLIKNRKNIANFFKKMARKREVKKIAKSVFALENTVRSARGVGL